MHDPLNAIFNEESFRLAQRSNSSAEQSRLSSNKVKNAWSSDSILISVHVVTTLRYFVRIIQKHLGINRAFKYQIDW